MGRDYKLQIEHGGNAWEECSQFESLIKELDNQDIQEVLLL